MSNWRPCRPSDDSGDAGQPVVEKQDLGTTTLVAFEPPYILEPELQSHSPLIISPILQHDTQESDVQPHRAEGPLTCSHLPTADDIQEDHLEDGWEENINIPDFYPSSLLQDIRENMALENRSHCLDHGLGTLNENVSDTLTNATMNDVSPSQHYQVDEDTRILDRKIDDLLGLAPNTDTNRLQNVSSHGMLQIVNPLPITEPYSPERPNHNIGLLAPYDPVPDLGWPSPTYLGLFITPQEFAMPAPIGPSTATMTHQSELWMNPIPIRPKSTITQIGSKPTTQVGQPSLTHNHMETGKRKLEACSSPTPSCGDLLIVEQLTQDFRLPIPKRTRRPYTKKTCLRCREHREKCTGGIPCHSCRSLWNKPRQRKSLQWTACFDSDLRELGYFLDFIEDIGDKFDIIAPKKLVKKVHDKLDSLATDTTNFLGGMFQTDLPVQGLLGSTEEVPEDNCISGCDHDLSVYYVVFMHPRYAAELMNLDQVAFMALTAGLMQGCLDLIYRKLQRIRSGKPMELGFSLVDLIKVLSIVFREPANQAAGVLQTAASSLIDEETEQCQEARDTLIIELKGSAMRNEDQLKHLMLYLDWCLNKFKGYAGCNRLHVTISKLQDLGYDWHPASLRGRVT